MLPEALGAAGGAGLGASSSLLDLLAPLDYPRQSLWNAAYAPFAAASEGDYSQLLRAAPGLLGGGLGALAGGPLGAVLGAGAAQGLARLTGDEHFNAPTGFDAAQSLGVDTQTIPGMAAGMGMQMAGDPLTYLGMLMGGRLAGGANAARAGQETAAANPFTSVVDNTLQGGPATRPGQTMSHDAWLSQQASAPGAAPGAVDLSPLMPQAGADPLLELRQMQQSLLNRQMNRTDAYLQGRPRVTPDDPFGGATFSDEQLFGGLDDMAPRRGQVIYNPDGTIDVNSLSSMFNQPVSNNPLLRDVIYRHPELMPAQKDYVASRFGPLAQKAERVDGTEPLPPEFRPPPSGELNNLATREDLEVLNLLIKGLGPQREAALAKPAFNNLEGNLRVLFDASEEASPETLSSLLQALRAPVGNDLLGANAAGLRPDQIGALLHPDAVRGGSKMINSLMREGARSSALREPNQINSLIALLEELGINA